MSIRMSQGLKSALFGQYGIQAMMQYGRIDVYTGTQPVTANESPSGTLLGTITNDGDPHVQGSSTGGLRLDQDVDGRLIASGDWRLTGVAAGTAGWWRWKWNAADDNSVSLFYPRIDGVVGTSLILANTAITGATNEPIGSFIMQFLEA